jgi:DNA-binding IclR family transcriptional regulator
VRQRITKMTGHQARVLDQPDTHQREKSQASGTQTLLRGLALLECVAEGIGDVKGIAARLGTPRSTTHRMLNSLVAERYLLHVPYKGYLLGPKLIHLGMRALEQRPLVAMARPHIEALARRTGDTVHLGVLEGSEVFYLDKISGTRGLEMRSRVGLRMPIACTGLGKGLMLGLPRDQWHGLYERAREFSAKSRDRPPLAPWPEFERRLASYVERDWSFDLEENEIGIRCVGAPVRDVRDQVVAAISVASAVPYMPDDRMEELGPMVRATADAISKELGWKPE